MASLVADAFLSDALGRAVLRLDPSGGLDDVPALLSVPPASGTRRLVYAKLPTTEVASVSALERAGFGVIDTNVTMERDGRLSAFGDDAPVRLARPEDRDAVVALAGRAFTYSRFHLDPRIERGVADQTRALWVANFFAGNHGDGMVIAHDDGRIVGFTLLLGPADDKLTINLIAVAQEARRQGLARSMIAFAAQELGPVATLVVGTQIANTGSLRLYESLGFRVSATQYVLHHHTPAD